MQFSLTEMNPTPYALNFFNVIRPKRSNQKKRNNKVKELKSQRFFRFDFVFFFTFLLSLFYFLRIENGNVIIKIENIFFSWNNFTFLLLLLLCFSMEKYYFEIIILFDVTELRIYIFKINIIGNFAVREE